MLIFGQQDTFGQQDIFGQQDKKVEEKLESFQSFIHLLQVIRIKYGTFRDLREPKRDGIILHLTFSNIFNH